MMDQLRDWLESVVRGAGSAALSAAIAYAALRWSDVPLAEPYKMALALILIALWNRLRGEQSQA